MRGACCLPVFIVALFAFSGVESQLFQFNYPHRRDTEVSFRAPHFTSFTAEWQGANYKYTASANGFKCTVFYFKVEEKEKASLIDILQAVLETPDKCPYYAEQYFTTQDMLARTERNSESWGSIDSAFMFRQCNTDLPGWTVDEKNMYGYGMADRDLFVKVHLSKSACTAKDSTEMRAILASLSMKK